MGRCSLLPIVAEPRGAAELQTATTQGAAQTAADPVAVAILGFFGIETAGFAALLAGAGVAIGAAWSGMLANFAAGAFLQIFRPMSVEDIGMVVTTSIQSVPNQYPGVAADVEVLEFSERGPPMKSPASQGLDVEEKLHHIAFLHHILLAFAAQPTAVACFRQ
jgi:hypothetical protein